MHATGLFFLRHAPSPCRISTDGTPAVLLDVCERDGPVVRNVTAIWTGDAARTWLDQHAGQLRAGTALALELTHLRAHRCADGSTELHAHVHACALAPTRWPRSRPAGHQAAPTPQTTQPPTHEPVAHHPV